MSKLKIISGIIGGLLFSIQANASFLDVTGGFNVVTFGKFSLETTDVHGGVAAGGNVTISNSFGINTAAPISTTSSAIVSNGNVTLSNNGQVNGNVYAKKSVSVSNVNVTGTIYANSDYVPFTADYSAADALSDVYDNTVSSSLWQLQDGNSTLSLYGTDEVNYYDVNASDLQNVWSLKIADQSKYSVINVHGSSAVLHYNKMNYGTGSLLNASNILFNFVDAAQLNISSVYGNILAKDADVTGNWGEMYGSLVADTYVGHTQFHMDTFDPPTQDVPEGTVTPMIIAGLFFIVISNKRFFQFKR